METIFKKIIFEKNGFAIIVDKANRVFKINLIHKADDILDIPVKVKAKEIIHKTYGKQYQVENYTILEKPLSFFLRKVVKSGLPKETITKLCTNYTLNEFKELLLTNPQELLKTKNLGKARLDKIIERFEEKKELIELTELLANTNITSDFLQKVYKFIQKNKLSPEIIKKNPYILTTINGIGFKKADDIALKIGIDELSEIRIKAYILYAINQVTINKGDILHIKKNIFDLMIKELGINNESVKAIFEMALMALIKERKIISLEIENKEYLVDYFFHLKETGIIRYIKQYDNLRYFSTGFKKEDVIKYIQQNAIYPLSEKQQKAIIDFTTTSAPFFILAGYAGAGKTTTAKMIMDLYAKKYGEENIIACALSGNASNRIKNVTGYNAYTIHSLLGYRGDKFLFNKDNPLKYKLIVLDEASMVDISLFYALINAIDFTKTKLFIIGDNAQLQPVGAGEVFSDMLQIKEIEKIILDKVFRQDEKQVINIFAQDIRKGKVPYGYKEKKYNDFVFSKREMKDYFKLKKTLNDKEMKELRNQINELIKDEILKLSGMVNSKLKILREKIDTLLKNKKTDKINILISEYIYFFQIIVPQKKGIIGTINLNEKIKQIFIPDNTKKISRLDKVIHLRNKNKIILSLEEYFHMDKTYKNLLNYDIDYTDDKDTNITRVFNGQVGIVIDTFNFNIENEDKEYIAVYYPNDDYVTLYNDEEIRMQTMDLSYVFTIHKSQGSEYKNVVIPMSFSNAFMFNNKMLYTAITRAKNKLVLIGESYAFEFAIKKSDETQRKTLMKYIQYF